MKLRKYNAKMYLTGFMFIFQPLLTSFRGGNRKYSSRGKENIPPGRNIKYSPGGNMKYSSNRNMKYTFSSFLSQVGGHRGGWDVCHPVYLSLFAIGEFNSINKLGTLSKNLKFFKKFYTHLTFFFVIF